MLYDSYYLIMRYLSVLSYNTYSEPYFMTRKSLPHHSFSFLIFQDFRELVVVRKWNSFEMGARFWLFFYVIGRLTPEL